VHHIISPKSPQSQNKLHRPLTLVILLPCRSLLRGLQDQPSEHLMSSTTCCSPGAKVTTQALDRGQQLLLLLLLLWWCCCCSPSASTLPSPFPPQSLPLTLLCRLQAQLIQRLRSSTLRCSPGARVKPQTIHLGQLLLPQPMLLLLLLLLLQLLHSLQCYSLALHGRTLLLLLLRLQSCCTCVAAPAATAATCSYYATVAATACLAVAAGAAAAASCCTQSSCTLAGQWGHAASRIR
jgi:hypothetical protein